MDLEMMRASYTSGELDQSTVDRCPVSQLKCWLAQAEETKPGSWFEVNAMTLATSEDSSVTARIVLLKRADTSGLYFYTNRESQKGRQLAANPRAALVFYWPHLERQIRVEGGVIPTDKEDSDRYFQSRPRGSQIGAVASEQSKPVSDRKDLEQSFADTEQLYADRPIQRPEHWGGYRLDASRFEFWQGRPNRLHDRVVYDMSPGGTWEIYRLAP